MLLLLLLLLLLLCHAQGTPHTEILNFYSTNQIQSDSTNGTNPALPCMAISVVQYCTILYCTVLYCTVLYIILGRYVCRINIERHYIRTLESNCPFICPSCMTNPTQPNQFFFLICFTPTKVVYQKMC